ncbi:acyl-CoA dehydrogenase family protein [Natronorubrum daqingense]|uniref:Acyl-CoA dehydrogenase n=1 Tax=Natronorubrum daqingense TaxID=588898 RepID=A0A1N7EU29_9EURY|nr:acyl-CoA dehydrogenase family protein [Natronorubrum daqingense]APX97721.1 acyl-CoA dehydrogenase [Natronorubrum daqingense]SIR91455.1 Acyl-CoA dehydrogenase [Natronorubrum daqingense]
MITLSDEQELLVSSLEDLAEREFTDRAFTWDGDPPWENVELLAEQGFLGINIAEEYGGGGMTEFDAMLTIEAVGRVCPDTAEFLYNQQMVAPRAIELFGTDEAKERYLPPVVAGEDSIAIGISEPEAGSDVGAMRTTVEEDGDDLRITGEKTWVSNVEHSSAVLVWTQFPEGLGSVVVDFDAAGVSIEQHYENMAEHHQTHFVMEDVVVPEENVVTRGSEGFKNQLRALNWERLGSATLANAIASCALDKALEYAEQRTQFDQPIADFQGIEWKLADAATDLEASRSLTHRAAIQAHERGRIPDRLDASMAKLRSSEMVERVVSEALQIHGANGYQQGHPLEYLYRLARGRRLAAGTDEVQKNQIASVLKQRGLPDLA